MMDSKEISDKKIGIFSVGTAGHVMPSVRIIAELKEQGFDLNNLLVVTGNRDEKKYYKNLNVDIIEYDFVRTKKSRIYYFINFFGIIKSLYFLNQIVRTNNISVIFTTGSYIAPLISILGYIKKIPVYLQEQNIYAGLGNYIGSFFGKKVYTSFPDTEHLHKKKIYFVGPILDESIEGNRLKLSSDVEGHNGVVSIGIQGGSQGSQEINDLIYETFKDWGGPLELPIKLIHITGGLEVQKIDNEFVEHIILDFVEDMASYYGSINFQITRGGGGILESALLQIINVIIPYKYGTTSKHQKKNALYLTEHHAAIMIEEPNKEKLLKALEGRIWAIQVATQGMTGVIDRESPSRRVAARMAVKQGARELIANELYDEYKKSI